MNHLAKRRTALVTAKSYVLSFSKGVSRELARTGVTVTALCPPTTYSTISPRSNPNA